MENYLAAASKRRMKKFTIKNKTAAAATVAVALRAADADAAPPSLVLKGDGGLGSSSRRGRRGSAFMTKRRDKDAEKTPNDVPIAATMPESTSESGFGTPPPPDDK